MRFAGYLVLPYSTAQPVHQGGQQGFEMRKEVKLSLGMNGVFAKADWLAAHESITVSVVERSTPVRNRLQMLIGGADGFTCGGTHAQLDSAVEKAPAEKPDILLIGLESWETALSQMVWQISVRFTKTKILALIPQPESGVITALLESGVSGCLVRPVPPAALLEAVVQLHHFGFVLSSEVAQQLIEAFKKRGASRRELEGLTRRELEILDCLAQGFPSKAIASHCSISLQTVNTHLANIYDKLGVRSRTAAISKYLSPGVLARSDTMGSL